jgi:hypothetical protein
MGQRTALAFSSGLTHVCPQQDNSGERRIAKDVGEHDRVTIIEGGAA